MDTTFMGEVNVSNMCRRCPARRMAAQPQDQPAHVLDDLTIRYDRGRVTWRGRDPGLTMSEFRVVVLLATDPGAHKSYRVIYDNVHYAGFHGGAGSTGFMGNVRCFIKRIRCKFKAVDPAFDRIENYTGFGYMWRSTP